MQLDICILGIVGRVRYGYGDQDQWRVALTATGHPYHCLGPAPWKHPAFVLPLNGRPLIVHRCQGKEWDAIGTRYGKALHLTGESRLRAHMEAARLRAEDVFDRIYRERLGGPEAPSGAGSTAREAIPYLALVRDLVRAYNWRKVVDLGCGDGYVAQHIEAQELAGVDCEGLATIATAHEKLVYRRVRTLQKVQG